MGEEGRPQSPHWEGGPSALPMGEPVNRFLGCGGLGAASEPFEGDPL
jgi:hypothetical protein